jgi:hypothetical protein
MVSLFGAAMNTLECLRWSPIASSNLLKVRKKYGSLTLINYHGLSRDRAVAISSPIVIGRQVA